MASHIIITEPPKSHNIKCPNALKQLNNKPNIHNGNSIEQHKEKSSIIMHKIENQAGNYLIKSNNIKKNYNNKKRKKN